MEKLTLTIKKFRINTYNQNQVVLAENSKLQIQITLPQESGKFFFCYTLNNTKKEIEIKSGDIVEITPSFGSLTSYVTQSVNGAIVARYEIEPLFLKSGGLDGQPVIIVNPETAKTRQELEDEIKQLKEDITTQIKTIQKQLNNISGILYELYSNDTFVEEMTKADFMKKVKGE